MAICLGENFRWCPVTDCVTVPLDMQAVRVVAWGVLTILLAVLVNRVVVDHPTGSLARHLILLVPFAILAANLILRLLSRCRLFPRLARRDSYYALLIAAIFSIAWGRHIFLSFFFHDEIGYFAVMNQNLWNTAKWIFLPLNEHWQPPLKLLLVIICNLFGIDNYFGIALTSFLGAIALLLSMYILLRLTTASSVIALVCTGLFAISFNFCDVYQYKAAGMPLILSMLFLILSLLQFTAGTREWLPERPLHRWALFVGTILPAVFFSSLVTVPCLYLFPFLWVRRAFFRKDDAWRPLGGLSVMLVAVCATGALYLFRWWLQVPRPAHLMEIQIMPLFRMIGSFASYHFFVPEGAAMAVGIVLVAVLLAALIALLFGFPGAWKEDRREALALIVVGFSIVVVATAQVYAGRGYQLAGRQFHRYEIFPVFGMVISGAGALALIWPVIARVRARLRLLPLALCAFLVLHSVWAHFYIDRTSYWPLSLCIQIGEQRRVFFAELRQVLLETRRHNEYALGFSRREAFLTLPDFEIPDTLGSLETTYSLQFYARALASPDYDENYTPFVPPGSEHMALAAEPAERSRAAVFFRRFFPQQLAHLKVSAARQ
jgi:hypothetical protein